LTSLQEAYFLEVSSPGLDRPFKTDRDFERALGKGVEATFYKKIDGAKSLKGVLDSFTDETLLVVDDQEKKHVLERKYIAKIHYRIEF
jgi:ribosome maturation factor RimP